MVETEELLDWLGVQNNHFLYDNFQSTEQINAAVTQTGFISPVLHEFKLATGVQSGSTARAYYVQPIFNPVYAKLLVRLYVGSMADCFAFIGFKANNDAPTFNMAESHSGIMINDGKLYFSTANELGSAPGQQRVEITGLDMTRDYVYEIAYNKLRTQPFPYVEEGLTGPITIPVTRKWTLEQSNDNYPPEDFAHNILFYIENTVNADRYVAIRKLILWEDFAD